MKVTGAKTLTFSQTAWEKMWGMTLRSSGEVSGLGIVDDKDPNRVVDFFIVEQECTGASTDMDPTAVANLILDMRDKGVDPSRWRVWWHSHASMKAFFSGTDEDNVERYASTRALWSVVTNHADAKRVDAGLPPTEMYIRADLFDPDNPKNVNSPMRYTIEGCQWKVDQARIVPNSWFLEEMKKVNERPVQRLNAQPGNTAGAASQAAKAYEGWQGGTRYYGANFQGGTGYQWDDDDDTPHWSYWNGGKQASKEEKGEAGAKAAEKDDGKKSLVTQVVREGSCIIRRMDDDPDDYLTAQEELELAEMRGDLDPHNLGWLDHDIGHPAIAEAWYIGLLEDDEAAELSGRYEAGKIQEAGLYEELVNEWNQYLREFNMAYPITERSERRQEGIETMYEAVKELLDSLQQSIALRQAEQEDLNDGPTEESDEKDSAGDEVIVIPKNKKKEKAA